jgi:DNA-binding transcriptional MerR regulator
MDARERELLLRLVSDDTRDGESGSLPSVGCVVQERRLPHSRLAEDDERTAAPRPGLVEQSREKRSLVFSSEETHGLSFLRRESRRLRKGYVLRLRIRHRCRGGAFVEKVPGWRAGAPVGEEDVVAWSTRELADLAGTTVNTVRHYHEVGLLPLPSRRYNGYKQYRVEHLVELIRLRRFAELGVPLGRIQELDHAGTTTLHAIDTALEADIERLQRARSDVAAILRENAPPETPRGFEAVVGGMSDADRSLIQILARLYDPAEQSTLRARIARESPRARSAFYELHPDASDDARARVASGLADGGAHWRTPDSAPTAMQSFLASAVAELYRPVQLDVLRRAASLIAA